MATYTKPLKQIEIMLMSGGESITATDTIEAPVASQALAQFLAGQTMSLVMDGTALYIPFHSVAAIAVTIAPSEDITRDPYGCDDSDGGDGEQDVDPDEDSQN